MSKKNIVICPPTAYSINNVLKNIKPGFCWAYLGEDTLKAVIIERQIKNIGKKLEIAAKLQQSARELRQQYIDYIGKLSTENNSLRWWAGILSEKNPFTSKTFLHVCYMRTSKSLLSSSDQHNDFVFFVENKMLRKSLAKNISDTKDYSVKEIEIPFLNILSNVFEWVKMILTKIWFVVESTSRILLSKYFYKFNRLSRPYEQQNENSVMTLIYTWVDDRSFDSNGNFHDSYFGELASYLKKNRKEITIVPAVLNPVSPYVLNIAYYLNALKNMQKSSEKFLLPYAFVNVKDILSVAFDTLPAPEKKEFPLFEGIDISELIYDDLRREWRGIQLVRDLVLYKVVEGWKKADVKINSFVYPFENHGWEKVLCLALKKFYPEAKIIGYQHSTLSKMLLNYFYSQTESDIIPLPDRIITNGSYPVRLFRESAYDSQKIIEGGAIRYARILKESEKPFETKAQRTKQKFIILVATSIGRTDAAELVWKTIKAFENTREYEVIIKCHPVMPYDKFGMGIVNLPKNFRVSHQPIQELLKESDVLLYTCSSTCIEALTLGVPVIHVESDHIIDIDQLDFAPEARKSARSPEEIKRYVKEIEATDRKELLLEQRKWNGLVKEVFGEVNDAVYSLFIT